MSEDKKRILGKGQDPLALYAPPEDPAEEVLDTSLPGASRRKVSSAQLYVSKEGYIKVSNTSVMKHSRKRRKKYVQKPAVSGGLYRSLLSQTNHYTQEIKQLNLSFHYREGLEGKKALIREMISDGSHTHSRNESTAHRELKIAAAKYLKELYPTSQIFFEVFVGSERVDIAVLPGPYNGDNPICIGECAVSSSISQESHKLLSLLKNSPSGWFEPYIFRFNRPRNPRSRKLIQWIQKQEIRLIEFRKEAK